MYINRTEKFSGVTGRAERKSRSGPAAKSEGEFSDTMAAVIEIDVVEIGDQRKDQKQQHAGQNSDDTLSEERPEAQPALHKQSPFDSTAAPAKAAVGLDIKV